MLATKKVPFKISNGLSLREVATISQETDPKLKKIYPAKINPKAIKNDPRMLVAVPKYANLFITDYSTIVWYGSGFCPIFTIISIQHFP